MKKFNNKKPYIIAEIGVNHNGSIEIAKRLIKHAKVNNFNAVKFQTYLPNKLLLKNTPLVNYQKGNKFIDVWTDTDYAGCRVTRKSTSGGLIMLGKHIIRTWSAIQRVLDFPRGRRNFTRWSKEGRKRWAAEAYWLIWD